MRKTLFVILDGAAEDGRSALSAAAKPYLDMLASNSLCGMWEGPSVPKNYNVKSLSEIATLGLLGYPWTESPGRGFLEALGIGLRLKKGAVYFRANFATVDKNMNIVDRRAGRDERGLNALSKKLFMKIGNVKIKFYRSAGHRGVLELSCGSKDVTDSDIGNKKPQTVRPLNKAAAGTAEVVNTFLKRSHEILSADPINKKRKPANYILVRGAGSFKKTASFRGKYGFRACSVSNSGIVQGISRYIGMDVIDAGGFSDIEKNLSVKADIAIRALDGYDFVLLHINGADVFAHNKDLCGKANFISRVDREVFSKVSLLRHVNIVVTSDHKTSSKTGEHIFGPVPFLFYSGEDNHGIKKFDEKSFNKGFTVSNLMEKILCCE